MKDMNTHTQVHAKTMRRVALGLLAALAVTLGTTAVPLAGTAHAASASGAGGDIRTQR